MFEGIKPPLLKKPYKMNRGLLLVAVCTLCSSALAMTDDLGQTELLELAKVRDAWTCPVAIAICSCT